MQSLKIGSKAAANAATNAKTATMPPTMPPSSRAATTSTTTTSTSAPLSRRTYLLAAGVPALAAAAANALSPRRAAAAGVPDLPGCTSLTRAKRTGIEFCDAVVGDGPTPNPSARVRAHYTGRLQSTGAVFDSSYERRRPLEFKREQVVKGWGLGIFGDEGDETLPAMREGGKRRLVIPSEYAYGERGAGGVIPPGATLVFDVELLGPRKR